MVVIRWFLLSLVLSITIFGQFDWYDGGRGYYQYTPTTVTATNITDNSATIIGSNSKLKLNKQDTLSTKRPVQNWMVLVGVDSLPGLSATFLNLTDSTDYTYYHSIFVTATDGDIDYYKGDNKTFLTDVAPVLPDAYYIVNKNGSKFLFKGDIYAIKFKD